MDKQELQDYSDEWVQEGFISESQQEHILEYTSLDKKSSQTKRVRQYITSNSSSLIALVGSIFITLGVLSFLSLLVSQYNVGLLGQSAIVYPLYILSVLLPYYISQSDSYSQFTTIAALVLSIATPFVGIFSVDLIEKYLVTVPELWIGVGLLVVSVGTTRIATQYQSRLSLFSPLVTYFFSLTIIIQNLPSVAHYFGGTGNMTLVLGVLYSIVLFTSGMLLHETNLFKSTLLWSGLVSSLGFPLTYIITPNNFARSSIEVLPILPIIVAISCLSVLVYQYRNTSNAKGTLDNYRLWSSSSVVSLCSIALVFLFVQVPETFITEFIYIIAYGLSNVLILLYSVKSQYTGLFNVSSFLFVMYVGYLYFDFIVDSLGGVFSFLLFGALLIGISIYLKNNQEPVQKLKSVYKN